MKIKGAVGIRFGPDFSGKSAAGLDGGVQCTDSRPWVIEARGGLSLFDKSVANGCFTVGWDPYRAQRSAVAAAGGVRKLHRYYHLANPADDTTSVLIAYPAAGLWWIRPRDQLGLDGGSSIPPGAHFVAGAVQARHENGVRVTVTAA